MANPTNVVTDGEKTLDRHAGNGAKSRWLAAGILVGLAIAFFLFGEEPFPSARLPTEPDPLSVDAPAAGLRDIVPGFPDGLLAVSTSNGLTLELTIWPATRPNYETQLPLDTSTERDRVRLDASGRRMATLHQPGGEAQTVLIAGMPEAARPIEFDVTGYAWHDSAAGFLAFTTVEDNELLLWVMTASMSAPQLLSRGVGPDGGLVAWGDWGFALQDDADLSVTLLTPEGEITRLDAGRFLDSHVDGSLVIADDEVKVYGATAGVRGFGGRFSQVGDPLTAEISPDGQKLAVLGNAGLLVLPFEGDSTVSHTALRSGMAQITWSSDSRFILVPGVRGLSVLDTRNGRLTSVLEDRTILGASILERFWP